MSQSVSYPPTQRLVTEQESFYRKKKNYIMEVLKLLEKSLHL